MKTMLMIDGDGKSTQDFARMLSIEYCVTHSPSIMDALGLLRAEHVYDVILCVMEGISGRHIYDLTRELQPEVRRSSMRPKPVALTLDDYSATLPPARLSRASELARAPTEYPQAV